MEIVETVEAFRAFRQNVSGSVGFVPTMGALHEGHLSLMRIAGEQADNLAVSIFVNPTQFGPDEDFDDYPRELEEDAQKCKELGCDVIFAPTELEMYSSNHATSVEVESLTNVLCGAHRPGHFEGVCTIVSKLFNVVHPDIAVFGEKDYQQLAIIRRMTEDLNFPVDIVGAPIVREEDGLAVSSRNKYLDDEQRQKATCLSQALKEGWIAGKQSNADANSVFRATRHHLLEFVDAEEIDYVNVVHPKTLESVIGDNALRFSEMDDAILLTAVHIGEARLIDNIHLKKPLPNELK